MHWHLVQRLHPSIKRITEDARQRLRRLSLALDQRDAPVDQILEFARRFALHGQAAADVEPADHDRHARLSETQGNVGGTSELTGLNPD